MAFSREKFVSAIAPGMNAGGDGWPHVAGRGAVQPREAADEKKGDGGRMSNFPWKKTMLWTGAVAVMIGLGWTAAQIAGPSPKSAGGVMPAPFLTGVMAAKVPAEPRNTTLACLQAWVGHYPCDKINGQEMFDEPAFASALRKTLGEARYKQFLTEKENANKFLLHPVEYQRERIRVDITDLEGANPFGATFVADPRTGTVDACWQSVEPDTGPTELLLHTGERFPIGVRSCNTLDIKYIYSPNDYVALLKQGQNRLIGTWAGTFEHNLGRGIISTTNRRMAFTNAPDAPGTLNVEMRDDTRLNKASFKCSGTNGYEESVHGTARVDRDTVEIVFDNPQNARCIKSYFLNLRLVGDRLVLRDIGDQPKHEDEPLTKVN